MTRMKAGASGIVAVCSVVAWSASPLGAFADQPSAKKVTKPSQKKKPRNTTNRAKSNVPFYRKQVDEFVHGKRPSLDGYDAIQQDGTQ